MPPPTTTLPSGISTKDQARADAKQILRTLRTRRTDINITDIVLVGEFPMTGNPSAEVVKVTYDKAILNAPVNFPPATAFQVPPAQIARLHQPGVPVARRLGLSVSARTVLATGQRRSTTIAMPWPPPTHMLSRP